MIREQGMTRNQAVYAWKRARALEKRLAEKTARRDVAAEKAGLF